MRSHHTSLKRAKIMEISLFFYLYNELADLCIIKQGKKIDKSFPFLRKKNKDIFLFNKQLNSYLADEYHYH